MKDITILANYTRILLFAKWTATPPARHTKESDNMSDKKIVGVEQLGGLHLF